MDNWADKSTFCCETCQFFVVKEEVEILNNKTVGRCRRNAPIVVQGYPVVFPSDFCGEHKLGNSPQDRNVRKVTKK